MEIVLLMLITVLLVAIALQLFLRKQTAVKILEKLMKGLEEIIYNRN